MPPARARGRDARRRAPGPRAGRHTARGGKPTVIQKRIAKPPSTKHRLTQPDLATIYECATTESPSFSAFPAPNAKTPTALNPRVERFQRSGFMCSLESLYFVQLGSLQTHTDAETIALNLMDHFMRPEHYLDELLHGHLHATCFLFAARLLGLENDVRRTARAVEFLASGLASRGYTNLDVHVERVERGCLRMIEQREELRPLLGDYADFAEGFVVAEEDAAHAMVEEEERDNGNDEELEEALDLFPVIVEEDDFDVVYDDP